MRIAQADVVRDEIQIRQWDLRSQQLKIKSAWKLKLTWSRQSVGQSSMRCATARLIRWRPSYRTVPNP
jgi:hypothetical protein